MKWAVFYLYLFVIFQSWSETPPGINETYAVLILGQDVGDYAPGVMDEISSTFQAHGIKVYTFYFPNADLTKIKSYAENCSYFVYCGHGYANGGLDGEFGGIYINDFVMAADFVAEVHFKKHPLVIIQNSCGAAGTSAGDKKDIGFNEAKNRITDTALPYFMAGCGSYFASNWMNGSAQFLDHFLSGKSLQTATDETLKWLLDQSFNRTLSAPSALAGKTISIRYTKSKVPIEYNLAFVGDLGFKKQHIQINAK
jgi:hypothetical protein